MAKVSNTDIYNYDNFLDARDFLLGTDWNNARKTKNFKLEHLRHFILQGLDPSNNGFITTTGYTLVGNLLTINANWVWQLNGMLFTNEEEVIFTLEYTADGFVRTDSIYANSNNELVLISGPETETIAVPPVIPINTLLAFSVSVFDTSIIGGDAPVLGNFYVKKDFYRSQFYSGSGANVVVPLNPNGYSNIYLEGTITSVDGFSFSELIANPANSEYPHEGKLIRIYNWTSGPVTLNNEITNPMFFQFRNSENFVLPVGESIQLVNNSYSLVDVDKSFTTTEDVIGLPEILNLKADLVAGKVPASQLPSYVDDVLEFTNLAGFPATGEAGKIYLALDTNFTYRWTGSVYLKISDTGKLDKVTTVDVEKVYIKNADGTQGMKPVSELGGGGEKAIYTHFGSIYFGSTIGQWHTNVRPSSDNFLTKISTNGVLGTASVPFINISSSLNLFDSATQIKKIQLAYFLNSGTTNLHFYIISQDSNDSNTQVLVDEVLPAKSSIGMLIKNFTVNVHSNLNTNSKLKFFVRDTTSNSEIYDVTMKYTYE